MDKVILVMNDPTCCVNCPLLRSTRTPNTWVCGILHNNGNADIVFEPVDIDSDKKPDWCPLKPVPEKIDVPYFDDTIKAESKNAFEVGMYMYDRGHYRGYNLCIDKILNT